MSALLPVAYRLSGASGLVQILRTGSGFWRSDHGHFAIDEALLRQILANTQTVGRPLRVDYMHWANAGFGDGLFDLVKAAQDVDPADLLILPWIEPETGAEGWGIFAPVEWTGEARAAIHAGVDQISPVIDWAHHLSADVPGVKAGTRLGPTIVGISLVDEGFFRMDPVQLYQRGTVFPTSFALFQEVSLKLKHAQLLQVLQALQDAGLDDATIDAVVEAMQGSAAAPAPEYPEPSAGDRDPPLMPASRVVPVPGAKASTAKLAAARPAAAAAPAPAPAPVPVPARNPLAAVASLLAASRPAPTSTPAAAAAPASSDLEARLAEVRESLGEVTETVRHLLVAQLRSDGRLAGIEDPEALLREAPAYFAQRVSGKEAVTTPAPLGSGRSPLGAVREAAKLTGEGAEEEAFARKVSAYQEAQAKAGRVISYRVALAEVEGQQRK